MKCFLLAFLMGMAIFSSAQKPLSIGNKMPDWRFTPLVNGSADIRLSQYKGKAVLLCFWSSTCGSSLTMLTKTAAWEQQFPGDFKTVFVVDDKDPAAPAAAINKRPSVKALGIPLMKRDTALLQLFPHNGGPHIVLVGKDGHIDAITGMGHVKTEIIEHMVKGREISLPERKPTLAAAEQTSLIMDGLIENDNLVFNSVFTGPNDRLAPGLSWSRLAGARRRLLVANFSLENFYRTVYATLIPAVPFEKEKYLLFESPRIKDGKKYCYEQLIPAQAQASATAQLRYELDRYFGFKTTREKRLVDCWLVKPVEGKAKKSLTAEPIVQDWPAHKEMISTTIVGIAVHLNRSFATGYFRAEGDSASRFDLKLKQKYNSEEELKTDLEKEGFILEPARRELTFVVVRDAEGWKNGKAAH